MNMIIKLDIFLLVFFGSLLTAMIALELYPAALVLAGIFGYCLKSFFVDGEMKK